MDEMLRTLLRLAITGDTAAREQLKEHLLRTTEPVAERTLYGVIGQYATAQDDLNNLAFEAVDLVGQTYSLKEYYPDKIGIVSMTTQFQEAAGSMDYNLEVPSVVDYIITRVRERFPSPYQPIYFVRCIFDHGRCVMYLYANLNI